jgi:hypothetical protein
MINHHCVKYNCVLRRFKEDDCTYSLGIWTFKNIKAGCSLFYHYGINNYNHIGEEIKCLCKGRDLNNIPLCDYRM